MSTKINRVAKGYLLWRLDCIMASRLGQFSVPFDPWPYTKAGRESKRYDDRHSALQLWLYPPADLLPNPYR